MRIKVSFQRVVYCMILYIMLLGLKIIQMEKIVSVSTVRNEDKIYRTGSSSYTRVIQDIRGVI